MDHFVMKWIIKSLFVRTEKRRSVDACKTISFLFWLFFNLHFFFKYRYYIFSIFNGARNLSLFTDKRTCFRLFFPCVNWSWTEAFIQNLEMKIRTFWFYFIPLLLVYKFQSDIIHRRREQDSIFFTAIILSADLSRLLTNKLQYIRLFAKFEIQLKHL